MAKLGSQLQVLADTAPEAGFSNVNYGKLTAEALVVRFKTGESKHEAPDRFPMKDGYERQKGEQLELHVTVNISEFNPSLQFEYERNVGILKSSARKQTDWSEIVGPSLVKVFGADWGDAILKGPYVEVEDVTSVEKVNKEGKPLGCPKFLRVFKNRAECEAARAERFGAGGNGSSESAAAPAEVISQVQALVKSVGEKQAMAMLQGRPYGDYDPQALIDAAKA